MSTVETVEALLDQVKATPEDANMDESVLAVLEDAIREGVEGPAKYFLNIQKARTFKGVFYPEVLNRGQYIVLTAKKSVHIVGIRNGKVYDRTFNVGDVVEYDSYNYRYTAPITAISLAGITVKTDYSEKTKRMNFDEFTRRNYNLNLAEIERHNADTDLHI